MVLDDRGDAAGSACSKQDPAEHNYSDEAAAGVVFLLLFLFATPAEQRQPSENGNQPPGLLGEGQQEMCSAAAHSLSFRVIEVGN
jgi:hypothetical protein